MNETDREKEQEFFVSQTASLDVFAKAGESSYARFRLFEHDSLMLLRTHFPAEFFDWLPVVARASTNQATDEQLREIREKVVEYRLARLGLKTFGPERENALDALTVLILLCLENWPKRPEAVAKTSIVQGIDEFATTYIDFFGNSRGLLEVLKRRFEV